MRSPSALAPLLLALGLAACSRNVRPEFLPGPPEPRAERAGREAPAPEAAAPLSADLLYLRDRQLVVPVAGARAERIEDSFGDARDGGARQHRAIDILAPRGTPVLAADDGYVLRMSTSALGGITIYATDETERMVYYYAHLEGYRPGLAVGDRVAKGDTLGYVGTTGNAPANVPHLHFQVMRMPADKRGSWNGEPVNPFPLLVEAARARQGMSVRQTGKPESPRKD
jgi:peptidoglycan LD-endopeptidase LytH